MRYRRGSLTWVAASALSALVATASARAEATPSADPAAAKPAAASSAVGSVAGSVASSAATAPDALEPGRAERCMTDEEMALMRSLAKRGRDLDLRQQDLDARERRLRELEGHLETRIRTYTELQRSLKQEAERRLANAKDRAKGLAKIYESMSPSDAAARLSQMERDVAVEILRSMKGPAAGKVLASLDSDKAVDLSQGYVEPDASPDSPSKSETP